MKTAWNMAHAGFTGIGGLLGWYLGGMDGLIYALIVFVMADYFTGVLRAIVEKNLSSQIGANGIAKKVAIFLIVGVVNITDMFLLGDGNALRTAVIFFYTANEGLSLLENTVAIGLPVPEKLKDALVQLHKSTRGDGE